MIRIIIINIQWNHSLYNQDSALALDGQLVLESSESYEYPQTYN